MASMEPYPTTPELKSWDPSLLERASSGLQSVFMKMGADPYKAGKRADTIIGGPRSNLPMGAGIADIIAAKSLPVTALMTPFYGDETGRSIKSASEAADRGDYIGAGVEGGFAALNLLPAISGITGLARRVLRKADKFKPMEVPEIKPIEVRHAPRKVDDARRQRLRALLDEEIPERVFVEEMPPRGAVVSDLLPVQRYQRGGLAAVNRRV